MLDDGYARWEAVILESRTMFSLKPFPCLDILSRLGQVKVSASQLQVPFKSRAIHGARWFSAATLKSRSSQARSLHSAVRSQCYQKEYGEEVGRNGILTAYMSALG